MASSEAWPKRDREVFDATLGQASAAIGLRVDEPRRARMYAHFRRMVDANRRFNLTRITSPAAAAVKHYADSLALLAAPWVDAGRRLRLLDVGTGAGFPAIPLAIMCEHWQVTAADGTGKKARFVAETAGALGLFNVRARHARGADLAREAQERFDLVVLRAVGKIAAGLKECHSLVGAGGAMVFYKTVEISVEELRRARRVARSVGLAEIEPFFATLVTPDGSIKRQLMCYQR